MRVMRLPEVIEKTGLGRTSVYKLIREGDFPKPVPLGNRCVGWVSGEIDAWIMERIDCRDRQMAEMAEAFTQQ